MTPTTETEHSGYDSEKNTISPTTIPPSCREALCIFFVVANVIIIVLGIAGNGLVIWIAGFKLKKSVISTWYLSLAMSDFIFCSFLPFDISNVVKEKWIFGNFMCKFWFFNLSLNLYSSIFLLVIISVDRCVVIMFPVWAQNHRTVRKASVIVVLAWIISAALSSPMAIYIEGKEETCSNANSEGHTAEVVYDFIFAFAIPFLIIVICYVIILQKLKSNQMVKSKKPFKIMTALIVTFLICWMPYHTFTFMTLNNDQYQSISSSVESICFTFVSANSCLNPFLYAFMGNDFKKQCYSVLTKIENAIQDEENQQKSQGTAVTASGESNLSTAV